MKKLFGCTAMALALVSVTVTAEAKGCIKGALVGGTAGHFAGHHGILGLPRAASSAAMRPTRRHDETEMISNDARQQVYAIRLGGQ
jgi:hypothetical protein